MELEHYFKAGSPLLYLPTSEYSLAQEKVWAAFRKIIDLDEVTVGTWKVGEGLCLGTLLKGSSQLPILKPKPPEESDLLNALSWIGMQKEPVLVIFHNMRFFMGELAVIQGLIDATLKAKLVGSHIILLGPVFDCPPELKSLIVNIPFGLPSYEEIEKMFTGIAKDYGKALRFPDGKRWFKATGKIVAGKKEEDLAYRSKEKSRIISAAARSACGMDLFSAETAISLSIACSDTIDPKIIGSHKRQEVARSETMEFIDREEDLGTLGGFGALKTWLTMREKAFTPAAREYGLSYPKGILIVGVSGSGKSLAAKAIGTFLGIDTLRLDGSKLFRKYVGESEQLFDQSLKIAEVVSPCNLWIDELEKIFAGHASSGKLDSGVTSHILQSFLTWRQETKKPVMLVATANNIESLPPELTRKGRFDEIWVTGLPTAQEREEIFCIHLKKRKRNPENFDTRLLAMRSEGFVGAELESAIEDAMYAAFFADREVQTADILHSLNETVPQSKRDAKAIQKIMDWAGTRARSVSNAEVEKTTNTGSSKIRRLKKGNEEDE